MSGEEYRHRPLDGLFSLPYERLSNADIAEVSSYAEASVSSSPSGRVKHLALLFHLIHLLQLSGVRFAVKGGIILQYILGERARPTHDLDLIIPGGSDELVEKLRTTIASQTGSTSFRIASYTKIPAGSAYYYDSFHVRIEVIHEGEPFAELSIDGIANPFFEKIELSRFPIPPIIAKDAFFLGVPPEYLFAEKLAAITNELPRPYKHLVDAYSLLSTEIDVPKLRKYLAIIRKSDDEVRKKLGKEIADPRYQIPEDKPFVSTYLFPALHSGYQIGEGEMRDAVNEWMKTHL